MMRLTRNGSGGLIDGTIDSDGLSSRMLAHNTLSHKLEIMKKNSKHSPAFYKKASASILKTEQNNNL